MQHATLNSFQKWATEQLTRAGYKVEYVANWVRVNDHLDLMSHAGVHGYIEARKPQAQ